MKILKSANLKQILIISGILLFSVIISGSIVPAEEKTPPYAGWKPEGTFQPFKPAPKPPARTVAKKPAPKPVQEKSVETNVNGGNFKPQEYVVQEGDWIAKILREKGVLTEKNLPKLLELLRKFNQSMTDLNMIKPGEKIVILVKVAPVEAKAGKPPETEKPAPLKIRTPALPPGETPAVGRQLRSESYRIQRGDILSMIVMHRYNLTTRTFISEYLDLFKQCNPSIKDPDRIFAGQTVKLPLYPPQWYETVASSPAQPPIMRDLARSDKVRLPDPKPVPEPVVPIRPESPPTATAQKKPATAQKAWVPEKTAPTPKRKPAEKKKRRPQMPPASTEQPPSALSETTAEPEASVAASSWQTRQTTTLVSEGLGDILPQMGEQWIHSGEHFIPMKSGGHINLKADTYPIVKRHGGTTLIVDLYNSLPPRLGRVIESSWGTYRIVHLSPTDDLKSAFGKILEAFQYPKVFKKDEPLKLSGTVPVSITGDWIVIPPRDDAGKSPEFIVINLLDDKGKGVPQSVKAYLEGVGVLFVEYPSVKTPDKPLTEKAPETAQDARSLVEMVLTLTGHPHEAKVKIPAFKSQNDDFKLTVTADFYLTSRGQEKVIDLSGLDPEIIALLKERGISVLPLSKERNPLAMASKTLKFLGWQHKMGPLILSTAPNAKQNVNLTLSGLRFFTEGGHSVFMTPLDLPPELAHFLYEKGYRVVTLAAFPPGAGARTAWSG